MNAAKRQNQFSCVSVLVCSPVCSQLEWQDCTATTVVSYALVLISGFVLLLLLPVYYVSSDRRWTFIVLLPSSLIFFCSVLLESGVGVLTPMLTPRTMYILHRYWRSIYLCGHISWLSVCSNFSSFNVTCTVIHMLALLRWYLNKHCWDQLVCGGTMLKVILPTNTLWLMHCCSFAVNFVSTSCRQSTKICRTFSDLWTAQPTTLDLYTDWYALHIHIHIQAWFPSSLGIALQSLLQP